MTEQLIPATSTRSPAAQRRRAAAPPGPRGHSRRHVRASVRGPAAAGVPAVHAVGGRGARIWDVDGNEYVDLMCSYGPVVLGHQHPAVEAAARAQAELGRLPERAGRGHGRAGRAAGGHRPARGLGHVRQERDRRDDDLLHDRQGSDGPLAHPGGDRRVSRRRAVVHAAAGGRDRLRIARTSATTRSTTWSP